MFDAIKATKLAWKHAKAVEEFGGLQKGKGKELIKMLVEHDKTCPGCKGKLEIDTSKVDANVSDL